MTNFKPLFTWRSAITESDLPATARHVALTLSLHMNERGGSCFPSQETLSDETGLHVKTVRNALRQIEDAGYLRRDYDRSTKGRGTRVEYQATDPTTTAETTGGLVPGGPDHYRADSGPLPSSAPTTTAETTSPEEDDKRATEHPAPHPSDDVTSVDDMPDGPLKDRIKQRLRDGSGHNLN